MDQPLLGRTISKLRKTKGLTQDELCEACGLNVRTLQRIENGDVHPRTYTLKLLSEELGQDLWSEESPKKNKISDLNRQTTQTLKWA